MRLTVPRKFYPVVHCVCPHKQNGIDHALYNARIAFQNAADGIFLIGHKLDSAALCFIYEEVRKQYPTNWIGVNFLDVAADRDWGIMAAIVRKYPDLNALWIDGVPETRLNIDPRIEVFGGVAFKYINPNIRGAELIKACCVAMNLVDTITTSGDRTGSSPEVSKLEVMKEAIGDEMLLAVASGITVGNVDTFFPTVTKFIVASSIVEIRKDMGGHEYFVPEKVRALAAKIHG